jgi:hypothetical protein
MMSEQKKEWKVGDELAICRDGEYEIYKIKKISKTGRMTLGTGRADYYVVNPDLTIRGLDMWSRVERDAYIVTDDIRKKVERQDKVFHLSRIFRSTPTSIFTNEELDQIIALYIKAKERAKASE